MYKDKYKHLTTKQLKQKVEMLKYAETMNTFREDAKKANKQTKEGF